MASLPTAPSWALVLQAAAVAAKVELAAHKAAAAASAAANEGQVRVGKLGAGRALFYPRQRSASTPPPGSPSRSSSPRSRSSPGAAGAARTAR